MYINQTNTLIVVFIIDNMGKRLILTPLSAHSLLKSLSDTFKYEDHKCASTKHIQSVQKQVSWDHHTRERSKAFDARRNRTTGKAERGLGRAESTRRTSHLCTGDRAGVPGGDGGGAAGGCGCAGASACAASAAAAAAAGFSTTDERRQQAVGESGGCLTCERHGRRTAQVHGYDACGRHEWRIRTRRRWTAGTLWTTDRRGADDGDRGPNTAVVDQTPRSRT